MGKNDWMLKNNNHFPPTICRILLLSVLLFITACAGAGPKPSSDKKEQRINIAREIILDEEAENLLVKIRNKHTNIPYAAFHASDPHRIVVDLFHTDIFPLKPYLGVEGRYISEIRTEQIHKDGTMIGRIVFYTPGPVEYSTQLEGKDLCLTLTTSAKQLNTVNEKVIEPADSSELESKELPKKEDTITPIEEIADADKDSKPLSLPPPPGKEGIYLQVGAYHMVNNLKEALHILNRGGYSTYILKTSRGGKDIYSVIVGPYSKKEDARLRGEEIIHRYRFFPSYVIFERQPDR